MHPPIKCKSVGCNANAYKTLDFCLDCDTDQEASKTASETLQARGVQLPLAEEQGTSNSTADPKNPKDMIGATKLPVGLVPDTVSILAAMSFAEGASKYGAHNWRASGVRMSIYMEAMRRHQIKLWNGEWADKKTKVPHLASIIACAAIIEDARLCGKLVDDRPPAVDMEAAIEEAEAIVKHVQQLNAHMHPKHWTQEAMAPSGAFA